MMQIFDARSSTIRPPRIAGAVLISLLAGFAVAAWPSGATAQEATTDEPGIIERDEDDSENGDEADAQDGDQQQDGQQQDGQQQDGQQQDGQQQDGQQQDGQQQDGQQQDGDPREDGEVITPDNANPNEKYNLPPNFDPDYRPRRTPGDVKVTIDFRQANLEEVVKFFSGAMDLNFIIADNIQANKTITIISPQDVTLDQAYRAFLAALQMNGLTIVRMGKFHKIVQAKHAISEPQPTYGEDDRLPNEARMVTAILQIDNAEIDKIRDIVGNFTSPAATVITHQNSLIITESASNLKRIRRLVDRLDKGDAGEKVFVYEVKYADAKEVGDKIKEIFEDDSGQGGQQRRQRQQDGQGGQPTGTFDADVSQLITDERTNQLIVVTSKNSFKKVREMIELLDVPTEVGGQVHVKFLEYADADELSSTLSSLVSAAQQSNQRGGGGARRRRGGGGGNGEGGPEVGTLLQGDVQITSYKPKNALVVVASPKDYVSLEHVIDTLDRPRKQVYVEAVIMEISMDTNSTLGVGYNVGLGKDFDGVIPDEAVESGAVSDTEGLVVGQSNFPGLQGLGNAISGTGGAIGLLGPLVEIPGTSISLPAFAMLLQATQTDNAVNILSTPSILTMDNEEAEIVVGERVPFLRGVSGASGLGSLGAASALGQQQQGQQNQQQSGGLGGLGGLGGAGAAGLGGLGGLVSPIDYQDVGLTLRIKPQINESRYVRLEVDQEVSDIKGAGGSELTPTQTRRNAKTVVLVKDQSTVVIGGLMRDVQNETIEKVPFLGDIPLVGALFTKTSTITSKQNLVLMLTPYIVEGEQDLQKIYRRKLKERKELLKLFGRQGPNYEKSINFQKKSGIVDRMRTKLSEAVDEQKAREEAKEEFEESGPRYRILGEEVPEGNGPKESRGDGTTSNGGNRGDGAPAGDTTDDTDDSGNSTGDTTDNAGDDTDGGDAGE